MIDARAELTKLLQQMDDEHKQRRKPLLDAIAQIDATRDGIRFKMMRRRFAQDDLTVVDWTEYASVLVPPPTPNITTAMRCLQEIIDSGISDATTEWASEAICALAPPNATILLDRIIRAKINCPTIPNRIIVTAAALRQVKRELNVNDNIDTIFRMEIRIDPTRNGVGFKLVYADGDRIIEDYGWNT